MMDLFKAGITDLSWGFNGNILLASSTDGDVAMIQFQPGLLGTPCTEAEKRLIIQKKFGSTVLDDYVKNKRTQGQQVNLNMIPTAKKADEDAKATPEQKQ
jgi:hypothetical protein